MSTVRRSESSAEEVLELLNSLKAMRLSIGSLGTISKTWTRGMALPRPAVNYRKCHDQQSLIYKCEVFLSAIVDYDPPDLMNAIIDCALHVCLPNRHVRDNDGNFQLKFLLNDYWTPDESERYFVSVEQSTFEDFDSPIPYPIIRNENKQWWRLLARNPKAAIVGITGIAFSLIRAAIKDSTELKALYEDSPLVPSISRKIFVHTFILDIPETIVFSGNVLKSIAKIFYLSSPALQAILAPTLEFKRDLAKKKPNADPFADSYLNMLAMQSLRLIGMQPVKLIVDISSCYRIEQPELMRLIFSEKLAEQIERIAHFYIDNYSAENPDPAAEWSRCLDQGYYMHLSADNNPQLYGALVSIYLEAYPDTNILSSPTAKKLKRFINMYRDFGKTFDEKHNLHKNVEQVKKDF